MPPRFAYWTIILEGKPTAFRAQYRDDLLPTLKQLQNRHPDVDLKWFARGKLWESPEHARASPRPTGERRPQQWRPGGEHRDPRARFNISRDEKRRRFAAKLRRKQDEPASREATPPRDRFSGTRERPARSRPREDRPGKGGLPASRSSREHHDRPSNGRRDSRGTAAKPTRTGHERRGGRGPGGASRGGKRGRGGSR